MEVQHLSRSRDRKLLVSVFDAQEAREAILGGGRIIDSEDPRSALGNIKPRQIMAISDAVLGSKRDLDIQLSTNIGEDQLLFDRSETGQALQKSPYEIAGKAAQAAIGVSCAMGTRVHPSNLVKVGVDGMRVELVGEVLAEVVDTLNRTEQYSHCQVMSVLFAQDMSIWEERRALDAVRRVMVGLREFHPARDVPDEEAEREARGIFDLRDQAVGTLRSWDNRPLFSNRAEVSLGRLIQLEVLPEGSDHSYVALNELFPHQKYFPHIARGRRTTREVIKAMVDATADAGAHAIMLDTRIQSKVARVSLLDTSSDGLVDLNAFDVRDGIARRGILSLEDVRFFVDYCHYRNIEANLAGSFQSYQAQQVWVQVPEVDQVSTRGGSSGVAIDPYVSQGGDDTRQHRIIKRTLVRGLAPPEFGGVLNIPADWEGNAEALDAVREVERRIQDGRARQGLPKLETYFVDRTGKARPSSR